jgi:hypothetical protein
MTTMRFPIILGELKVGDDVTYAGFSDIDNHYGIWVFKNNRNEPLEIAGDFCNVHESFISNFYASLERIEK